jgi:chromosome segregation ATPase
MYFVLGLLSAGVFVLLVTPAIWRRAQRLSRARIEASVPMTLTEIQAEKDQLRAEFAMTSRRLEMNLEKLRLQSAEQTVEVHHKREELARLNVDHANTTRKLEASELRANGLAESLAATEAKLTAATADLVEREKLLAERLAALDEMTARAGRLQELTDEQKLELVARNTEIANLGDQLENARTHHGGLTAERDGLATAIDEERTNLANERVRAVALETQVARLEAERNKGVEELERRNAEIKALEAEMASLRQTLEDERRRAAALESTGSRLAAERDVTAAELQRRIGEIKSLDQEIASGRSEADVLTIEIATLKTDIARREAAAAEMRESLNLRADDIARRGREAEALEAELVAARARSEALSSEIDALKAEVNRSGEDSESLRSELSKRTAESQELWTELASLEAQHAGAHGDLAAVRNETDRLRAELTGHESQTRDLDKRLSEAMKEIVTLEMEIEAGSVAAGDNTRKAIVATEAENEALRRRLHALEEEQKALKAENLALQGAAGTDWNAMRSENAMLRDRLAAIAADVLRMSDGAAPASPPLAGEPGDTSWRETPLAPAEPGNGDESATTEANPLSERLRALQQTASRH